MPANAAVVILIVATILIGALCWIWMQKSRASQSRMEQMQSRLLALMEEQNQLLRRMLEK